MKFFAESPLTGAEVNLETQNQITGARLSCELLDRYTTLEFLITKPVWAATPAITLETDSRFSPRA